jgi:alpha-L-fucosidase 2
LRGNETTGWSSGWRINLQARLGDAEKSYYVFRKLLSYISPDNYRGKDALRGGGTYPNLLDAHSPFQIDGNFGGSAGIAEMLMQSTNSSITLLPALPDNWKGEGSVSGLCARGGFEVAFSWKDGIIVSAQISSKNGGKTTLTYNGITTKINLKPGETKQIK